MTLRLDASSASRVPSKRVATTVPARVTHRPAPSNGSDSGANAHHGVRRFGRLSRGGRCLGRGFFRRFGHGGCLDDEFFGGTYDRWLRGDSYHRLRCDHGCRCRRLGFELVDESRHIGRAAAFQSGSVSSRATLAQPVSPAIRQWPAPDRRRARNPRIELVRMTIPSILRARRQDHRPPAGRRREWYGRVDHRFQGRGFASASARYATRPCWMAIAWLRTSSRKTSNMAGSSGMLTGSLESRPR